MHTSSTITQQNKIILRIYLMIPVLLQGIVWPFIHASLDIFSSMTIDGKENLASALRKSRIEKRGLLFIMQHHGETDFIFPLVAIPPFTRACPMFYVSQDSAKYKKKKFGWRRFFYGTPFFLKAWGAYPYITGQHDYKKSLIFFEELLNLGKSICIFPEGKISKTYDTPREVHGGFGYLLEATDAIVVPVSVLRKNNRIRVIYNKSLDKNELIDPSIPVPERYKKAAETILRSL